MKQVHVKMIHSLLNCSNIQVIVINDFILKDRYGSINRYYKLNNWIQKFRILFEKCNDDFEKNADVCLDCIYY